jgi:hypothetical protein
MRKPDSELTPRELRERNAAKAMIEMVEQMRILDGLVADESSFQREYQFMREKWLTHTSLLKKLVHKQFQKPNP